MTAHTRRGILLALASASFYGFIPASTRLAFDHGVSAVDVALFRTSIIVPVMLVLAWLEGAALVIPAALRRSFVFLTLATLLISTGYLAAVTFIPVGLAVILFYTYPVMIVLVAPLIEGRRISLAQAGIALLAFAGLVLALGPRFDSLNPIGVGLAMASAVAVAAQFFTSRQLAAGLSPAVQAFFVHLAIWPPILLLALVVDGGRISFLSGDMAGLGLVGLMAVGGAYVFAFFLHMSCLRAAPASTVAPFFNWEPVISIIIAGLFLGERLKPPEYAGGGLVLIALMLSALAGRQKAKALPGAAPAA